MKDKRLVIKLKNNTAGALDSVIRKYSAYICESADGVVMK